MRLALSCEEVRVTCVSDIFLTKECWSGYAETVMYTPDTRTHIANTDSTPIPALPAETARQQFSASERTGNEKYLFIL
jgi:hypothetical protein